MASEEFSVTYEFDCDDAPPYVWLCGRVELRVDEDPLFRGQKWQEELGFSFNEADWSPGPMATWVMTALNEKAERSSSHAPKPSDSEGTIWLKKFEGDSEYERMVAQELLILEQEEPDRAPDQADPFSDEVQP